MRCDIVSDNVACSRGVCGVRRLASLDARICPSFSLVVAVVASRRSVNTLCFSHHRACACHCSAPSSHTYRYTRTSRTRGQRVMNHVHIGTHTKYRHQRRAPGERNKHTHKYTCERTGHNLFLGLGGAVCAPDRATFMCPRARVTTLLWKCINHDTRELELV